jgi:hypothetical protein
MTIASPIDVSVTSKTTLPISVSANAQGPPGPAGPPGIWTRMTQAEYDALPIKDPDTLYIIVG